MARRINTPFVITLGALLAVMVGGVVIYVARLYFRSKNPVYLVSQAQEAEKKGDEQIALLYYDKAMIRALEQHAANASDLCMKVGDMAMKMSDKEKDRAQAESLYRTARGAWESALTENPRDLEARQKLAAEDYDFASASTGAAAWTRLTDNAQKLIELSPNDALPYVYRAQARLTLLLTGASGAAAINDTVAAIQADLSKAMKLDPKNSKPVVLMAELMWSVQAPQAAAASQLTGATKLQDQAIALLQGYLKKNPNEPEATTALFPYLVQRKQEEAGVKSLEAAYAAHKDSTRVANVLAYVYLRTDPAKAEKILKDSIAQDPNNTGEYLQLAQLYERTNRAPEAIATYKDLLQHPKPGGGLISYENDSWEAEAKYQISSLYMDVAEKDGPTTAAGKADLVQASDFMERFRAAKSDVGRQSILDGRLQLLNGNLSQAIDYLKRAEANLGGAAPTAGRQMPWLQTKMLLVKAYEIQQEWGIALQLVEQVLTNSPQNLAAIMEHASLLNRNAQYERAMSAIEPVIAAKPSEAVVAAALKIKAQSLYGLGNREEADKIMASLNSSDAMLGLARSHLLEGQQEQALDELNQVFEKDPTNQTALSLAVLANMQLDRKPEAEKLVAQALAKYPGNAGFQMMQAMMKQPNGDPMKAQVAIINSITDDYSREMQFAQLYHKTGEQEKEMASLQAAEKALEENPKHSQEALTGVVERGFALALEMGSKATDQAAKEKYWMLAKTYVQKAQRYNMDGMSGKLYEGQLQFAQGNQKDGLQTLEQAVNARPDFSLGRTVLGQEYLAAGRPSDASDQFRQAIQQKPDNLAALKYLISILLQKGDSPSAEQAQMYLKQALLFSPRDPQLTEFRDILAMNGTGDLAEAIRVREENYKADKSNLQNLRHLAILYVKAKEPSKAIALLLPLYEKNKEDLSVADTLARLYRETDQTNEALTIYERFLSNPSPMVRFQATLLLGELYQNMGQPEQAEQTFREAIGLEPAGSDQGERRLADLFFDKDDMKHAEEMYGTILAKEKMKDPLVYRRLAEVEIKQNEFAKADDLLNQMVFKNSPDDAEGLVLKGFSYLRQSKPADALKMFNTVLAKDPNNLDALHYRAFTQFSMQGNLDQATKDLLTVRDRNPSALNSRLLLARVYRASHHLAEAASEYRDVIALKPDAVPARLEYAQFLMSLSKIQQNLLPDNRDDIAYTIRQINPMQTLQAFLAESATRFPNVPGWSIMAGDLLSLTGRTADAQKLYGQAFNQSQGSPEASAAFLGSLLKTRDYENVVDLATRILAQRPNETDTYLKRAAAYAGLNKTDEAVADCTHALDQGEKNPTVFLAVAHDGTEIIHADKMLALLQARAAANPSDGLDRLGIGQTLLMMSRATEAVEMLKPLMTDPAAAEYRPLTLRAMALAEYEAKDYANAEVHYKELLKDNPSDLEALNNLSFLLAEDMHKPKDALLYAQQAVKVLQNSDASLTFVNNGNVYDTYGWVEFLAGDATSAMRDLRRATESSPIPIAYLHLAKVYQKAGQRADAQKAASDGVALATEQNDPIGAQLTALQKELAH